MLRNNHDPAPAPGLLPQTRKLQIEEDRFRFTPVKVSKTAPRVWDRKPSTSFLGRTKSRKVWKRFRTSFNSMKALQQLIAAEQDGIEEDLHTEINTAKNFQFLRGVKRRCLAVGEVDDDSLDAGSQRGRSFLETKWESEMAGRRRKLTAQYDLPSLDSSDTMTTDSLESTQDSSTLDVEATVQQTTTSDDESLGSVPETPTTPVQDSAYPRTLHGPTSCPKNEMTADTSNINTFQNVGLPSDSTVVDIVDDATPDTVMTDDRQTELSDEQARATIIEENEQNKDTATTPATAETVNDLTAEQESTLVRSALRSSLDGEDAALLNSFLSKAKAKRDAKAAMTVQDTEEEKTVAQEELVTELPPTPRSRRALEELDANSPSPQKAQVSPCKAEDPRKNSPDLNESTNKEGEQAADQQQSASPVGRRSTRMRLCKPPPRTTSTPAVRNTLSLRRAKGTEFVFLQRTEAQELALATRKNTRLNKGDALLPKYALQTLNQQSQDEGAATSPEEGKAARAERKTSHKRPGTKKSVSWNDERLEQYEGGGEPRKGGHRDNKAVGDDVADNKEKEKSATKQRTEKKKATSGGRSTRSQGLPKAGGGSIESPTASTTAPATATPKALRMRRLGASGSNSTSTTTTPGATAATSSTTTSSSSSSPRKMLTPKSPSRGLLPTPTTKSASTTSKSTVSGSGRTAAPSGPKSKSILQANAGSTPMPRRVRSKS